MCNPARWHFDVELDEFVKASMTQLQQKSASETQHPQPAFYQPT
jgi:hypothetical protein